MTNTLYSYISNKLSGELIGKERLGEGIVGSRYNTDYCVLPNDDVLHSYFVQVFFRNDMAGSSGLIYIPRACMDWYKHIVYICRINSPATT